jgi:beta-glucosidase
MAPDTKSFPDGFLWGAATSAYQIEGSPLADGAGVSNWHRFSHTPGRTSNNETGDVACDHYRRYREDVALMRELGLTAYRFSIAWSRVLPEGRGRVNEKGLDFYRRLVDSLLEAGIQPCATLFHWDSPAALDDRGAWLNPDMASWFAEYAEVMFGALDGRVRMWATLNEPWVVTDGGYLHGPLAPGHRNSFEAPIASFNLLRAHAAAVRAYRSVGKHQIGLVVNVEPKYRASESAEDVAATKRAEAYMNRQYLDPVFFGSFPEEMHDVFGDGWPNFDPLEVQAIRQPIDFLGLNYYTRAVTKNDPQQIIERAARVRNPRAMYTMTDWEVFPQGLTDTLVWLRDRYGNIPMYVTENGAAFYDPPVPTNGKVEDPHRTEYLREHFRAAREAIRLGVNLRGYFVWSLLDNYEWALGYSKRFGIIHVDYETQKRTPKASARFYTEVIRSNGATL